MDALMRSGLLVWRRWDFRWGDCIYHLIVFGGPFDGHFDIFGCG